MKRNIILSVLVLLWIFTSCQNKPKTPKVKEVKPTAVKIDKIAPKIKDLSPTFKTQITAVFTAYNSLKNALVAVRLYSLYYCSQNAYYGFR